MPCDEAVTDDASNTQDNDEGGTVLILIGEICDAEGEDDRGTIGWGGAKECALGVVTHSSQDDGNEVASDVYRRGAVRIGISTTAANVLTVGHCDAHLHETVSPEGPVLQVVDSLLEGDLVGEGVATILVNSANDEISLFLGQERVHVRECRDEKVGNNGQADGDSSLDNLPSCVRSRF